LKAIHYTKYGSPDVLQLKEVDNPIPKDKEVLVKVYAASVNSWDWDLLRGKPFIARLDGILKPKYKVLGADIAGIVEAVGNKVTQFQIGDEVFGDVSGCNWGGFAQYVCADEKAMALKSPNMTFDEAAATSQAAVLALQGLRQGKLNKGQKVLINGAGGGVGTIAIQIAKSYGTEVTAVDQAEKLDMLRSIGADHVIDYKTEHFITYEQRYDLILDVWASRSIFEYKRILNPNGNYVMIGGATSRIFQLMLLGSWISKSANVTMGLLMHKPNKEDLNELNRLFEAGKIAPIIDRRYPLSETADAFRYFGTGRTQGKIVITMGLDKYN
jgi:NADPH:quinone reductase-like Zn-dependent oxidoreductase